VATRWHRVEWQWRAKIVEAANDRNPQFVVLHCLVLNHLPHELRAEVHLPVLELDALGDSHAVLGDLGCAVGLLDRHVPALGTQRHLATAGRVVRDGSLGRLRPAPWTNARRSGCRLEAWIPLVESSPAHRARAQAAPLRPASGHLHSVSEHVDALEHQLARVVAEAQILGRHVAHRPAEYRR